MYFIYGYSLSCGTKCIVPLRDSSEKQEVYDIEPQGSSLGNESSNCYIRHPVMRQSYDLFNQSKTYP